MNQNRAIFLLSYGIHFIALESWGWFHDRNQFTVVNEKKPTIRLCDPDLIVTLVDLPNRIVPNFVAGEIRHVESIPIKSY